MICLYKSFRKSNHHNLFTISTLYGVLKLTTTKKMYKYILVYKYLYFRPTDYSFCMEKSRIQPPPVHNIYIYFIYFNVHTNTYVRIE